MIRWMLREIAEPLGWNPQSLANEARLSYAAVRPIWFNEANQIDLTILDKLSNTLKVSPNSLIGNREEAQGKPMEKFSNMGVLDILEAHHRLLDEQPEHRLFSNVDEVDAFIRQERESWHN